MLLDHIGAVFPAYAPESFRLIGRIAFPIYAYMIAQGCKHTKSINKYLLRLSLFALISEIPFDIAFMNKRMDGALHFGVDFLRNTNVFYTLFFGVACIVVYEKLIAKLYPNVEKGSEIAFKKKAIPLLVALPMLIAAETFGSDYGAFGVTLIFLLYLFRPENKITRSIILAAGVVYLYGFGLFISYGEGIDGIFIITGRHLNRYALLNLLFALIAVVLVFLYNGKQGPKAKWAFYVFYPMHFSVLAIIWYVLAR